MKKKLMFTAIAVIMTASVATFAELAENTIPEHESAPATPYIMQNDNSSEIDLNYKYSDSAFENEQTTPAVNNRRITTYTLPPVWEDYVPEKYQNPRRDFTKGGTTAELVTGIILTDLVFTAPIGIPMIVHSSTKFKNINYAKKKDKFEEGLKYAEFIDDPTQRRVYYKQLLKECKMTEQQKTKLAKKRAKQAAKQEKIKKKEMEKINNI